MNVAIVEHVPFEGPAMIASVLERRGHKLQHVSVYQGDAPPKETEIDALISMGGPMSVNDGPRYPWIAMEQELMRAIHNRNKPLLGVCLGAQQIAAALGSAVVPSPEREIGWFPVTWTAAGASVVGLSPHQSSEVLHWHGEMAEPPPGSRLIAVSERCHNQGFVFPHQPTVGLQFHLEMDRNAVDSIVDGAARDLENPGPAVSTVPKIQEGADQFAALNRPLLEQLLQHLGL